MSATSTMTACKSVFPARTSIQTVVIEDAIGTLPGPWPALILSCPKTVEKPVATGRTQEIHTIVAQYVDPWDQAGGRGVAQITADLRAALEQIKQNIRANRTLGGAVLYAGDQIDTDVAGVITAQGLPQPMAAGKITVLVRDLWI